MPDTGPRPRLPPVSRVHPSIALERGPFLTRPPAALPARHRYDRIRGMLLGLAIGDALGATTEGMRPSHRRAEHGEVRDYLPHPRADGRRVGLPTDDTQLAFWALERMLDDDALLPDRVLRTFADRRIVGIGATVQAALAAFRTGRPWTETGQPSAGNGALMRIAPVLLPHLRDPSPALWADTAILGAITHNDPASTAACIAFVDLLGALLGRDDAPPPHWWLDRFVATMASLEGETAYRTRTPHIDFTGPISRFTAEQVRRALDDELPVQLACDRWDSGAYLLETVPSVLYILARHGDDPEEAIVRAVNDTRDNDTIAAIVGAAVGALHGAEALPTPWRYGLLGRTTDDDDGRVFHLIDRALKRWG